MVPNKKKKKRKVYNQTITHRKKPRHSRRVTGLLIAGVIALIRVLVILARGTTYNAVNVRNIRATVQQWPTRLDSTSTY